MFNIVLGYAADQPGVSDWAKEYLIAARNSFLYGLTVANKSAADFYVQVFDAARKLAVPITDTAMATGVITAAAHEFETGDAVTLTSISGLTTGYLAKASVDTFRLYGTLAQARADAAAVRNITDTDATADTLTIATHGLTDGDEVYVAGLTGLTAATKKFARSVTASTISLYDSAAHAIAGGATGKFNVTADDETGTLLDGNGLLNATADDDTGSLDLTANVGAIPVYDLAVYQGSFLPFAFATGKKFHKGIYVRAVTAQAGSTLISSTDAKFTWDKMDGPVLP